MLVAVICSKNNCYFEISYILKQFILMFWQNVSKRRPDTSNLLWGLNQAFLPKCSEIYFICSEQYLYLVFHFNRYTMFECTSILLLQLNVHLYSSISPRVKLNYCTRLSVIKPTVSLFKEIGFTILTKISRLKHCFVYPNIIYVWIFIWVTTSAAEILHQTI